VPYPADYGGAIDVFYKIKALAELGVEVHLHAFNYGRGPSRVLRKYCAGVHYYKRKKMMNPINITLPYIVETRKSQNLKRNLLKDDSPIVFEGLHTTYYLDGQEFENRRKIVRMHNIEHLYYANLAKAENSFFKRTFFQFESKRLRAYQNILEYADYIAAISPADNDYLNLKYGNSFYLPVFHNGDSVDSKPGKGKYALYHGNLGIAENNEAALFLANEVFDKIEYPLIIAGRKPSKELVESISRNSNISLKANISGKKIQDLIKNAHINVLPTFQNTGIKLKLINVLYHGRHCVVNPKMVMNTGIQNSYHVAESANEMRDLINDIRALDFDRDQLNHRKQALMNTFCNIKNAELLVNRLFYDSLSLSA